MSRKRYDLITSGYVSMDRIVKIKTPARVGFTSLVENRTSADIQYGGCSVNIAHHLCKLGRPALPVLRVGEDYEDIGFRSFLASSQIPLDAVEVVEGERTSLCYLVQDNMGQHITLFYPGAMDASYARPLPDELFQNSGMGLMTVGSRPDNEYFFEACKRNGLPLVFSMKGDMDAFPSDFLKELLSYCSLIFTNEVERETIESICGESILTLFERGNAKVIVTTLGEKGSRCCFRAEDGSVEECSVPIYPVSKLVDTTGSGDGYVAGFLYGYLNGKPPQACAMLGAVLSSFIIEKEGCCTGAPSEEALLLRYREFSQREEER